MMQLLYIKAERFDLNFNRSPINFDFWWSHPPCGPTFKLLELKKKQLYAFSKVSNCPPFTFKKVTLPLSYTRFLFKICWKNI